MSPPPVDDLADPPRDPGPRPTPPSPEQCCGTACDPCIWTWHQRAVERWERRRARWEAACADGERDDG